MKQKLILLTACAFSIGVLVAHLAPWKTESGTVFMKEFIVVDATTGDQLNCTIRTPSMPSGKSSQLLLEMPPGGPYRATTAVRKMATLTVHAVGFTPLQILLDPYTSYHSIGGRITTETITLESVPDK